MRSALSAAVLAIVFTGLVGSASATNEASNKAGQLTRKLMSPF